jgi:hypothetical protein
VSIVASVVGSNHKPSVPTARANSGKSRGYDVTRPPRRMFNNEIAAVRSSSQLLTTTSIFASTHEGLLAGLHDTQAA